MSAHTIHAFMREKGLKAAVAILLAVAVGSPVAAGILTAVLALSTVPLKALLRPSKWPPWGVILYMAPSLFLATLFTTAPDFLMCTPVGRHYFCWEWLPLFVPLGVYFVLVLYDKEQSTDFCDAGTEILITRIEMCYESDKPAISWIVHSNVELDDLQLRNVQHSASLWYESQSSPQFLHEDVWYHLCLQSVHFEAESDGTRTRRVSNWCSPHLDQPVEFTYPAIDSTETYHSKCPVGVGLVFFALHRALSWCGLDGQMKHGVFLILLLFLESWLMKFGGCVDESLDAVLWALSWYYATFHVLIKLYFLSLGHFVLQENDYDATVRVLGSSALACVLLLVLADVPVVGRPIKYAASSLWSLMRSVGRAATPRAAERIKAARVALKRVYRGFPAPSAFVGIMAVTVASPARVLGLVVFAAAKSARGGCACLLVSTQRQMAIVPTREARSKYRRPTLVPVPVTRGEVESGGAREDIRCPVTPVVAGVSTARRRKGSRRDSAGRRTKKTVAPTSRKSGVVLGAMVSAVAPVRRSLCLAARVARSVPRA